MPADYNAITQRNRLELGTDLKSRRTQISLYSDPAHFVYELLQNADDHGASTISFCLSHDRLIVEHNAKELFTSRHVEAISSFENSTSEGQDLLKVGTFGLGFKSVFAITSTPRIFCGDESFEIFDLYSLRELPKPMDLPHAITRFELPFNHQATCPEFIFPQHRKSEEEAYRTIFDKLSTIDPVLLLFTRSLSSITVTTPTCSNTLARSFGTDGQIILRSDTSESSYRIWQRPISWEGREKKPVQIAIRLDESDCPMATDEPLVVLFPTKLETGMRIILNGPYRTTPSRENVGYRDPYNTFLIYETAQLLHETLLAERKLGRLSLAFLDLLPLESSLSPQRELFRPLHEAARTLVGLPPWN